MLTLLLSFLSYFLDIPFFLLFFFWNVIFWLIYTTFLHVAPTLSHNHAAGFVWHIPTSFYYLLTFGEPFPLGKKYMIPRENERWNNSPTNITQMYSFHINACSKSVTNQVDSSCSTMYQVHIISNTVSIHSAHPCNALQRHTHRIVWGIEHSIYTSSDPLVSILQ